MLYELMMAALAIVAVSMLFLEPLFPDYRSLFNIVDVGILGVFGLDYFIRLVKAKNKGSFFLHNIPDLIAIIPFSSLFRSARLVRLVRFARFSRTMRFAIYAQRLIFRFRVFFKTNGGKSDRLDPPKAVYTWDKHLFKVGENANVCQQSVNARVWK